MRAPSKTVAGARRLRRAMTLPEVILWRALRRTALDGFRFRRQHPIGPYILDFFCPEARLAIEVDRAAHDHPAQAAHDEARMAWLADRGIQILRLPARDVLRGNDAEHVLPTIAAACAERAPPPFAGEAGQGTPPAQREGVDGGGEVARSAGGGAAS